MGEIALALLKYWVSRSDMVARTVKQEIDFGVYCAPNYIAEKTKIPPEELEEFRKILFGA